jgi:hypothetical protein
VILFIFNRHGPAVFVSDGKLKADAEELRRYGSGVAVVDFNSAMVLEAISLPKTSTKPSVRICGPGLTFIRPNERIQGVGELAQESGPVKNISGVVDLRRQFQNSLRQKKTALEANRTSVTAYTRDGIELSTNIFALFTIGLDPNKDPNVLNVVYVGPPHPDNLRIVSVDESGDSIQFKFPDDELDLDDRNEIHKFVGTFPSLIQYKKDPQSRWPVFDAKRVFSAVYSRVRLRADEERILSWMELPVKLATDYFREILSQVNFDELYDTKSARKIEVKRRELRQRMRNKSLLSFRFLCHYRLGWQLRENHTYLPGDILAAPVQPLRNTLPADDPKILRERGIRMLTAGFGNLLPSDEVYLQQLASWRATWENDTKAAHAAADLDAKRIYNLARNRAQRELALSFQEIFEDGRHSKEALAVRVLQALETIASDRETRQLLPADTISMLQNIHNWLLPSDMSMGAGGLAPPPQDDDEG